MSDYTHEMRLMQGDRTWSIRFAGVDAHLHWTDLYNSCTDLIDGQEPDRICEDGVLIGLVNLPRAMSWEEIVQAIEAAGLCAARTLMTLKLCGDAHIIYIS